MPFEGDQVKSPNGAPPREPEDFAKFDLFQPSNAPRRRQATRRGSSHHGLGSRQRVRNNSGSGFDGRIEYVTVIANCCT